MSADIIQTLTVECPCLAVHCVTLQHYERVKVKCGRIYWALQPKRGGPLELFPWPGPNLTREEMTGKKSAEQIVRNMNRQDANNTKK